jgi:hypothetical protein
MMAHNTARKGKRKNQTILKPFDGVSYILQPRWIDTQGNVYWMLVPVCNALDSSLQIFSNVKTCK